MSFVHLHNHTDFSFLDGACKTDELCKYAAKLGMPGLAITDHGNLCGAISFYKSSLKYEIKPIIGSELYLTDGSRHDKGRDIYGKDRPIYHLLLLAKNQVGYHNLIKLSSAGYLEGFYKKPRVDYNLLKKHNEGIICLSGCLQSHICQTLIHQGPDEAVAITERYKHLFGDDFYLEIQNHGIEEEAQCAEFLQEYAEKSHIKLVVTNDTHYTHKEHAIPHDLLLCVQTRKDFDDPNRWRFSGDEFYLKTREEMAALFPDSPQALDNTLEIMEKCNVEFDFKQKHFPKFPLPENETSDEDYLVKLCEEGLGQRYQEVTPEIRERLNTELDIIVTKSLASYFLIVRDFIVYAKQQNIPVGPGRGSAAGSLVSYLIGITNIDPMRYDLLFERFINPERESYPDIDVDFSDSRRAEVIEYVKRKYGADCVSQIITFGRMLSKGVIRDVGRVLRVPLPEVDAIAKLIPDGPKVTLESSLKDVRELRELIDSHPEYRTLMEHALVLEGTIRNSGIHAAGVVITPRPLTELVPLYKAAEGEVCTQFDMAHVEGIGLLKVDFLGLKTLTTLERALNLIKLHHDELDLENISLDDEKTYELFGNGETVGIFQFESGGMRENLIKLKPEKLEDLTAMNALYRPGPMDNIDEFIKRKHGESKIVYLHPMLAEILDETYGIIVYQEQVMKIANVLSGMSLGRADVLRRAMGKKKQKLMDELKPEFVDGCAKNGINNKTAIQIWDLIEQFAKYGFNKSHAAGYALVAYQTGYLKAHYPAEFMAASMTTRKDNTEELTLFLEECRRMNVNVLPPDVNQSEEDFSVTSDGQVRFGLTAIKNVGRAAVQAILGARDVNGQFRDLFDLANLADSPLVNRKVLENLILAGATESLEGHRLQQLSMLDQSLAYAQHLKQERSMGQVSFFGDDEGTVSLPRPSLPDIAPMKSSEMLSNEKNLLGIYFSGHPLLSFKREVESLSQVTVNDLGELNDEQTVRIVGLLNSMEKRQTKKKDPYARGKLEDLTGNVGIILFPKSYERLKEIIETDEPVLLSGKIQKREQGCEIIVDDIELLNTASARLARYINITVKEDISGKNVVSLENEFRRYPGNVAVKFTLVNGQGTQYFMDCNRYKVKAASELLNRIERILGEDSVRLVSS